MDSVQYVQFRQLIGNGRKSNQFNFQKTVHQCHIISGTYMRLWPPEQFLTARHVT